MKLFNWEEFNESSFTYSKEDIHSICEEYGIINYTINEDGSIDVDSTSVHLYNMKLTKLPLRFRNVGGLFDCSHNKLTTLEGSPKYVGGVFKCYNNNLTSLEGGPISVGRGFICIDNQLTTLKGGPEEVGGIYSCYNNNLLDVEGFPEFYEGYLEIEDNPVFQIIKLFPKEKWCKSVYLINEYGAIDGRRLNSYVLEEIFLELGLTPPKIESIEGYKIV